MNIELEEAIKEIEAIKSLGTSGIVPRWKPIDILLKHAKNSISKKVLKDRIELIEDTLDLSKENGLAKYKITAMEYELEDLKELLEGK